MSEVRVLDGIARDPSPPGRIRSPAVSTRPAGRTGPPLRAALSEARAKLRLFLMPTATRGLRRLLPRRVAKALEEAVAWNAGGLFPPGLLSVSTFAKGFVMGRLVPHACRMQSGNVVCMLSVQQRETARR